MAQPEQIIERLHSREGKPSGLWDGEPDQIAWTDPDTGYPALMWRNKFGSWCGYVAVPPGHPAHELDQGFLDGIEVHGGITWSGPRRDGAELWWVGFDCGHAGDDNWLMAEHEAKYGTCPFNGVYCDVGYVRQEVSRLAQQLKEMIR